jgi:hypothetical protein
MSASIARCLAAKFRTARLSSCRSPLASTKEPETTLALRRKNFLFYFSYFFSLATSSAKVIVELICSRTSSGVFPAALSSSAISDGTYQWSLSE